MTEIYIAGASSRARTTKEYLETLYPNMKVRAFLVSPEMDDNPEEADGVPVIKISTDAGLDTSSKVYLGTRGVNHEKLIEELLHIGFAGGNIIPVNPELDTRLRNEYVSKSFEEKGKEFIKIHDTSDFHDYTADDCFVYVAKTVFDTDFSHPEPLKKYEYILQAGTALAENRLSDASYFDNDEDSISDKNKQFCELTGMYWIWKNSHEKIVGLEHWRRRFLLPVNWNEIMKKESIDVILPVPLCVMPSLEGNFVDRHLPKIWDASMEALKSVHPEDAEKAADYFRTEKLYSPCNMLITRKEIFDDYSAWLFPVLFKLNELIGTVEDKYQNRYLGFVSERLLNYYFCVRRSDLKIAYADKNFLS